MKSKSFFRIALFIIPIQVIALLVTFSPGIGQIRTTLLPEADVAVSKSQANTENLKIASNINKEPTNVSFLRFDLNTLPRGAEITECSLRLVTAGDLGSEIEALLFQVGNSWNPAELTWALAHDHLKPLGSQLAASTIDPVRKESPVIFSDSPDLCAAIGDANGNSSENKISFQIRTERRNGDLSFYSTQKGEAEDPSYKPRLSVTYLPPDADRASLDWRQLHHDAQHSGRSWWRIYNLPGQRDYSPNEVKARTVYSAREIYWDPVIYEDKLYNAVHAEDGNYYLRGADRGGRMKWQVAVDAISIQPPAVNQRGRLYYVTQNQVDTFDLENGGARGDRPIPIDKNRDTVISPPTLGPDGTLYLVTNPYIYAYSPYPQHQLLWKERRGSDKVSSVALSEDGKTAYIVDALAGELVALSASDGRKKWILSGIKLNIGKNDPMPIPVVAEDTLYVTSGFPIGDRLYVVHDEGTKGRLNALEGHGICTPVVGPDKTIYFFKAGKLFSYRPDRNREPREVSKTVSQVSNIVIDGSNNIYCWDKNTHWLYSFDEKGTELYSQSLGNLGPNLLIAPDGTLYNSNGRDLLAVVPSAFHAQGHHLDVSREMVRAGNNTVFRAGDSIRVIKDVVVEGSQSIILISGGTIGFSPGFTVKKGGRMICKTGF